MRESKAMTRQAVVLALCLAGIGGAAGCSSKGTGDATVVQAALTGDVTFTLTAPPGISVLSPVVLASNSVKIGSFAQIARPPSGAAPVIAMGTTGLSSDPDAKLDDIWSRGPVKLGDRVHVYGKVHAASVTPGSGTLIDSGTDATAAFTPPAKISWTAHFPSGTGTTVNLDPNQTRTISAGKYSSVRIASSATLTMNAGTYYMDSLDVEPSATVKLVQTSGPVIIYVAGSIIYRGTFVATNGAPPDLLIAAVSTATVFVEAPYSGALIAPFGSITVRFGVHNGYFAAKDVSVDANATVKYRSPTPLLPASNLPLQDCASQIVPDSTLTGKAKEIAFQNDIARLCSMPGSSTCRRTIVARANVDYATIAFSLIAGAVSPSQYLAVTRDRARKEAAAQKDATLANAICAGDQDGDFVPDSKDQCPNTPPLTATFDNGCTDSSQPDAPPAGDVSAVFGSGTVMIDPRCSGAPVLPDSVAGAFYRSDNYALGTYIFAGRVNNQPRGCAVWYVFDIDEYNGLGQTLRNYQVAFGQTEEDTSLVGLGGPVPRGYIQFNPLPTDAGTRGFLGSAVGGVVGIKFRVRTMNASGMRSNWSAWKITTNDDCKQLGFTCF
jgi:hypothetical protein